MHVKRKVRFRVQAIIDNAMTFATFVGLNDEPIAVNMEFVKTIKPYANNMKAIIKFKDDTHIKVNVQWRDVIATITDPTIYNHITL